MNDFPSRQLLAVALALLAGSTGAFAQSASDLSRGPVPTWTNIPDMLPVPESARGPLFMRRQVVEIHIGKETQSTFMTTTVRILDPSALALGNVALAWNPAAGKPVIHALNVYRDGVARDVLTNTDFTILRREDNLEAAKLDGMLTATLKVPDLRVGDDLEIAYSIPTHDPTLRDLNSGVMLLGLTPPSGRYALRLSWDRAKPPTVRPTPDIAGMVTSTKQSFGFASDNPVAMNPPKDAPARYSMLRLFEYSDYSDWAAVSSRMAPLFTKAATLSERSPVRQEASRIAGLSTDPLVRAQQALKIVQQQVRYVYVGLNGGNFTPATADETWERRYGDCKGKTALLLALLQELGVDAQPVLANNQGNDDGLNERLPSPLVFDHVLVQATIGGKRYWLDGTLPPNYLPSEVPLMPYRWILPVAHSGASLVNLPWSPAEKPNETNVYEIDARAGFNVPAKLRHTMIYRGVQALLQYYELSALSDEQIANAFRQNLEGSESWNTVETVTWRFHPKELASVIEIAGTGPVKWEDEGGISKSLTLPGGGFSPPARRQRGEKAASTAPFAIKPDFDCRVTTVRLPTATNAADWSYNSTYDTTLYGQSFRRNFELRDGSLRMMRVNRTLRNEISVATAASDTARLDNFDNSMALLNYRSGKSVPVRQSVPATFERDWVADPSACLALLSPNGRPSAK